MLEITVKDRTWGVLQNPQFKNIRYITLYRADKGFEPWFVAKDVAEALAYSRPDRMYERISDKYKMEINPHQTDWSKYYYANAVLEPLSIENAGLHENGGTQIQNLESNENIKRLTFISEPGFYEAIFGSTLPLAQEFKSWVFEDVLPSIRQYGYYMTPEMKTKLEAYGLKMETYKNNLRKQKLIAQGVKYPEWFEHDAKYREWEEKITTELDKMRTKEGGISRDQMIRKINTAMWNAAHVSTANLQRSFSNKQLMNLELAEQIPTEEDMRIFAPENINLLWAIYCDSKVCPLFTKYVLQGNYYMAKDVKPVREASFREVKFW